MDGQLDITYITSGGKGIYFFHEQTCNDYTHTL